MSWGNEFQTVGPATDKAVCAEPVAWNRLDDCWPNADAGGKQCQKLVCSGRSDTEELGCAGIGARAHQAYTGLVLQCQANVAQYARVSTDCG